MQLEHIIRKLYAVSHDLPVPIKMYLHSIRISPYLILLLLRITGTHVYEMRHGPGEFRIKPAAGSADQLLPCLLNGELFL